MADLNTTDVNVSDLNGSLDLLHDIIVPQSVGYFPPASGWIALVLLLLSYGFYWYIKKQKLYQSNLYRRQALQEWQKIQNEKSLLEQSQALLLLIKRVGLQHFGREKVAHLSADKWWDFVQKHSKVKIDNTLRELIHEILYNPTASISKEQNETIATLTEVWIETHQKKNGESND